MRPLLERGANEAIQIAAMNEFVVGWPCEYGWGGGGGGDGGGRGGGGK